MTTRTPCSASCPTRTRAVSNVARVRDILSRVSVGDRIRITPIGHQRRWWTVGARDERYVIAWRNAPFLRDEREYTVIDLNAYRDNGVDPGVVASSLNTLGGGWDIGPNGEGCDSALQGLVSGEWGMSRRRLLGVTAIETEGGETSG